MGTLIFLQTKKEDIVKEEPLYNITVVSSGGERKVLYTLGTVI